MPAQDYRTQAPVEPEGVSAQSEIDRLGTLRSVHEAPPLRYALIGPICISGLVAAVGALCGAPPPILAGIAAVSLGLLAWSPLRTRGVSVQLHARGLVLQGRRARRAIAFEDVNEIWFGISLLHAQAGAYLHTIRILDYSGHVHSVPIAVKNGATLANAVLRACSEALLLEAKRALGEGQALTFAKVQLDREGISIDGSRAAWNEIRLAVVSHARLHLYRRLPIFAWRTVRLDRVPNPAVFVGLVARSVRRARIDDRLIAPDDRGPPAQLTPAGKEAALKSMFIGGVVCVAGVMFTCATYANGSVHLLAWGPILFGAVRLYRGAAALWFRPPR
ncbi:MAG: hypothetical protein HOW73_37510 [Polyangiaceae bacterium]|nr:hypothetical protein [Polyangiaceae bacterium]